MGNADSSSNAPQPPGFHWTLVLLLEIVTVGLFGCVWAIVQALWAKKFDRSSKALGLYIVATVLTVFGFILDFLNASITIQAVVQIAAALIATFGAFSVKNSLARYTTGITGSPTYLSGLMTIIFGEVYLQYHMNRVLRFAGRKC
jgi:hypothetical protein